MRSGCQGVIYLIHRIEFISEILYVDLDSLYITDSMHMSVKGSWNCRSNTACECPWNFWINSSSLYLICSSLIIYPLLYVFRVKWDQGVIYLIHRIEFISEILYVDLDSLYITDSMHMSLKGSWNCHSNTVCECSWNWFDFLLLSIPYYMFSAWNEIRVLFTWFIESNLFQKYFMSISIRFPSRIPCICPWKVRGIAAQILHASVLEMSESILPDFIWFVLPLLFIPYYIFSAWCKIRVLYMFFWFIELNLHQKYFLSISTRFSSRIPCICPWKVHGIAVQILHVSVPVIVLFFSYYPSLIICFPREMRSGCCLLWFIESNLSQKYFMSISIRFTSRIPCICPWKLRGIAAQILHANVPEIFESILPEFFCVVLSSLDVPY